MGLESDSLIVQKALVYAELKIRATALRDQMDLLVEDAKNMYLALADNPDFTIDDRLAFMAFRDKIKSGLVELSGRL